MAWPLLGYFEKDNLQKPISSINPSDIIRQLGEYMFFIIKIEIYSERNTHWFTSTSEEYGMKNLHSIPKYFHSCKS